jgi:hypothetical protein
VIVSRIARKPNESLFKTPALVQLLTTKPKYTKVLTDLLAVMIDVGDRDPQYQVEQMRLVLE